ncbi:protein of unknown function, partial [Algoriphagus faecimaris]
LFFSDPIPIKMNTRFLTLSLILLGLVFFSCDEEDKTKPLSYQLTHAFRLVVEDHPLRTWSLQTKVIDGEEKLFFGDVRKKDNIKVFNMDTKEWEESIRFEKEGPDGIGTMNGFYVHTMDSIFVVNSFGWEIHLMNGSKKVRTYNTKEGIPAMDQITPFTTNNAISGIINGKLIFYGFPEVPYQGLDYHNRVKIVQSIDLKTGENKVEIGYPKEYHNHLWPGLIVIMNEQSVVGDKIYMNYPFSDSVYEFDGISNRAKPLFLGSTYKKTITNYDGKSTQEINGEGTYFEVLSKGAYTDILADEINSHLYRTISYSKSDPSSFSTYSEFKPTAERNLLIYDLDRDTFIGEIDFQEDELDRIPMMFVGEKGLYLSKMSEEEEAVDFYLLSWEE